MSKDAFDDALDQEEFHHFEGRHPAFRDAFGRLDATLKEALVRDATPQPGTPESLQRVVFFLAQQAADDFFDITFLAVHGYGLGALKLLRTLFERVVTMVYLMSHPDDVQAFNDYADVDSWRVICQAREIGVDLQSLVSADQNAALEVASTEARRRLGKRRSWTNKDLKTLANDAGMRRLYVSSALVPNLQLHTTRLGMEARLIVSGTTLQFAHGANREYADYTLRLAHYLVLHLLQKTNAFFGWGLDISGVVSDFSRSWGE